MRWSRVLRLVPAAVVAVAAACSGGEIELTAPPVSLSATALQGGVRLSWLPVAGADGYVVLASTSASFASEVVVSEDAVSPLVVEALAGGPWYFRIVVRGGGFVSPASEVVSVTPISIGTAGLAPLVAAAFTLTNGDPSAQFGFPVAGAGDIDGDGFDDLLVGAMFTSAGGTAFLYRGGPDGLLPEAPWERASTQTDAHFAKGLSSPGDVNGDGLRDLLVGAAEFDDAFSNEGRVWLYPGTGDETRFAATETFVVDGEQTNAYTGRYTAPAGDVNGDGVDDFAISFHALNAPQINEGRVCVWFGVNGGAPATVADWCDETDQVDAFLGYALSPVRGDADGDGFDDLLVGAFEWDDAGDTDAGAAFLYRGGPSGLEDEPSWMATGQNPDNQFGASLSFVGDVNGDGFDDAIVGGYLYGGDDRGRAYLYLGSVTGLGLTDSWRYDGFPQEHLGMGVGAAGDVNADGYADVIVGAYDADNGNPQSGRAVLFLGGPGGLGLEPVWEWIGTDANGFAGGVVASAGDLNGDGSDEIAIGVVSFEGAPIDNGRARIFFGAPSEGPTVSLAGRSGSFTDPAAGSVATCTWEWGDGSAADEITPCAPEDAGSPPHTFPKAGAYVVRLRVVNAYGLAGEAFSVVHATAP